MDLKYSWNGSTSNNVTDQPSSSRIYADTSLIISDIKPASGYYVRNVSCSKGSLGNSNGTYTYKVVDSSYSWPNPGSGFYDTVVVQMGRYTQQNINILSPSGSEDGQSGTMDVYYSFNNTRYDNQTNEPITGTSVKDNSYIEISDIRPATGMEVASVKVGNTSVSASNGVYRIDCNATQTIVIQMQWIKYNININILSPSGSEDYKSGTIDIYYSHTGDTYDDQTNEPITGNSIPYGSTVRISDIKPASGMRLSAVDDGSSNISNSNGTYSITVTKSIVIYIRMAWKEYYVDVNIMSPSGVQDNVSGTVDLTYSSPDQTVNDANNEPTLSLLAHGGTLKISDIKPATGYRVSSVSISENRGKLEDNGDGTYTFTASTDWTHQTKWYNTIVIQMAWKEYNVNINILSPTGAEDNKSGTVDLSYSSPSQTHNDVNNEPSPSRLTHGATLTISDIKPATGYRLSSVSINENRGSLVNNGDGTYTFTASADWTHQTNWYNTIVIQMAYQSYKLRIYAMKGIDDIRQPATTWYTDRVGRYKEVDVNYMTAYTTTVTVLSGYSFNKWTNTNNSNAAALSNSTSYKFTMPASNLTLYAFAKGNSYTISYSSNGKIVGTKLVTYGSSYGELLNISNTREGFTFGGWYLNNTFVTPITASTTVRTAGNHTLYAKWTAKNPAQYDEELGKWYVEMGKYPQTSIIDSDLRNWTEYNGSNYSNIMYDKATKMSTFTVKTVGVWEILAIQIPAPLTSSADGTYTLTFDYVVPNYNGLVSSDYSDTEQFEGSDGLAVQIINSNGPANTHCTDRDYLTYRLPTTASSGTVTATFTNISSTSTIWVVLNGGYVGDGQTLTISIGNFRLLTDAVNLTTSGNTYRLPTKQLEENMTHWTEYFYGENIATSYNNVTKQNTLTISASSGWEIIGTQVQVIKNTNYTINLNLISGATNSASSRPRLQVLNAAPTNGDNSSSQIAYLDLVDNGSKSLTFNSGNYETLYIILNGGYLNDGSTYNFAFAEFSFKNGKQEAYGTKSYNSYILSDGNEYLRYGGNWYKVEPVRYYLAGEYSSGYGTENGNVTAVTEKVVIASVWNDEYVGLGEGYHISQTTIWTNDGVFVQDSGLVDIKGDGYSENSYTTWQRREVVNFGNASSGIQIENYNFQDGISSTKDMDEVFGEGNYEAEFSDLVADILGNALMYWTRDVGSELNNAECITRYGTVIQAKMQNLLGARITTNVKTFACV